MIYDEAQNLFGRLALQVGFQKHVTPLLAGAPTIPSETTFWKSSYAQIIVVPIEIDSVKELHEIVQHAQEWLDLACMEEEQRLKTVTDGYILFLLPNQPAEEIEMNVRALELDPTACRKHFAWPDNSATDPELIWGRIFRVTSLGIPRSPISAGMTGSPLLASEIEKLVLEDIKILKGKTAARQHATPQG